MENSPLLRFISETAGIEIQTKENTGLNFDLSKNTYTRTGVIVLLVLVAYLFTDLIINKESYLETPPVMIFVAAGILAAALFSFWFIKNTVPIGNALGLALLIGVITGAATYPALLRLNQLTDTVGLKQYHYIHVDGASFKPQDSSLPDIHLFEDKYWDSLPKDAEFIFNLRKGGLGFYQIDMAPIYKKTRLWYCLKKAKQDESKIQKCKADLS